MHLAALHWFVLRHEVWIIKCDDIRTYGEAVPIHPRGVIPYRLLRFEATSVINSLWPSDAIWAYRTGWTSAQVMAWRVHKCWLIMSEDLWHSRRGSLTGNAQGIYTGSDFENKWFKVTAGSHGAWWVNDLWNHNWWDLAKKNSWTGMTV